MHTFTRSYIHIYLSFVYRYSFLYFVIFYLSLSFLAFMHFYHVFLTCSIYSIRYVYLIFISYNISFTCNILYLVNLYLLVLYLNPFLPGIPIDFLTKRLVHSVQQLYFLTIIGHQMLLNGIWLDSRLNEFSIESKNTHNGFLTKELCKLQAVKKISNLQQQQHPLTFVIFRDLNFIFDTGSLYSFKDKVLRILHQLKSPKSEYRNSRYVRNNRDYSKFKKTEPGIGLNIALL